MEKQLHLVIQAFLTAAPGLRENFSNDLFSEIYHMDITVVQNL